MEHDNEGCGHMPEEIDNCKCCGRLPYVQHYASPMIIEWSIACLNTKCELSPTFSACVPGGKSGDDVFEMWNRAMIK